jgi:hypothetical protein
MYAELTHCYCMPVLLLTHSNNMLMLSLKRLVVRSRLTIFLLTCLRIYPLRYTDLLSKDDIHRHLHRGPPQSAA